MALTSDWLEHPLLLGVWVAHQAHASCLVGLPGMGSGDFPGGGWQEAERCQDAVERPVIKEQCTPVSL